MIDWPDAESIQILQNMAVSMSSDSRLLIYDMVVEPLHRNGPQYEYQVGFGDGPEPLPPNYGTTWPYQKDLIMMNLLNGKERNHEEWLELIDKAGLELVKVWIVTGMETAILECQKKPEAF